MKRWFVYFVFLLILVCSNTYGQSKGRRNITERISGEQIQQNRQQQNLSAYPCYYKSLQGTIDNWWKVRGDESNTYNKICDYYSTHIILNRNGTFEYQHRTKDRFFRSLGNWQVANDTILQLKVDKQLSDRNNMGDTGKFYATPEFIGISNKRFLLQDGNILER